MHMEADNAPLLSAGGSHHVSAACITRVVHSHRLAPEPSVPGAPALITYDELPLCGTVAAHTARLECPNGHMLREHDSHKPPCDGTTPVPPEPAPATGECVAAQDDKSTDTVVISGVAVKPLAMKRVEARPTSVLFHVCAESARRCVGDLGIHKGRGDLECCIVASLFRAV